MIIFNHVILLFFNKLNLKDFNTKVKVKRYFKKYDMLKKK